MQSVARAYRPEGNDPCAPVTRCHHCNFPAHTELKQCSRCKQVKYCSRECQKTHWSAHKSDCSTPGSTAAAGTAVQGGDSTDTTGVPLASGTTAETAPIVHHVLKLCWPNVRPGYFQFDKEWPKLQRTLRHLLLAAHVIRERPGEFVVDQHSTLPDMLAAMGIADFTAYCSAVEDVQSVFAWWQMGDLQVSNRIVCFCSCDCPVLTETVICTYS